MRLFGREIEGYPKALVVLAAIFLVATGLCGVQTAVYGRSPDLVQLIFIFSGLLEIGAGFLSLAGIVTVLIAWPIAHVYQSRDSAQRDTLQPLLRIESQDDEQGRPWSGDANGDL